MMPRAATGAVRRLWLGAATCFIVTGSAAPASSQVSAPPPLSSATQLVVVTTAGWDATTGELRRFTRDDVRSPWRPEGNAVPIVVGRTGLAWGVGFDRFAEGAEPHKWEGDGRSPAGIFPLDRAFGFAPVDSMPWVRLRYLQLTSTTDCVDDTASVHYNEVLDRSALPGVDWRSAERMRQIGVYRLGVIIGYNAAPPTKARGSCVFFHIWGGPRSHTAGCTAMDAGELERLVAWLDPNARPVVVQVPAVVYSRVQAHWGLPELATPDQGVIGVRGGGWSASRGHQAADCSTTAATPSPPSSRCASRW